MPQAFQEIVAEKKTLVILHKKVEILADAGTSYQKLGVGDNVFLCLNHVSCLFWFLWLKNINIFKVPETPKEVIFEEAMRPLPMPEAVPAPGTNLNCSFIME